MATEVERGCYTHGVLDWSRRSQLVTEDDAETLYGLDEEGESSTRSHRWERPQPSEKAVLLQVFRHNPLHDFESMFWVAAWILVCSDFLKDGKAGSKMSDEEWQRRILYHGWFGRVLFGAHNKRDEIMAREQSMEFLKGAEGLLGAVWNVAYDLNVFRTDLLREYALADKQRRDAAQDSPFSSMASDRLYGSLATLLRTGATDLRRGGKDLIINTDTRHEKRMEIEDSIVRAFESGDQEDRKDGDEHRDKRSKTSGTASASSAALTSAGPSGGTRSRTPRERGM